MHTVSITLKAFVLALGSLALGAQAAPPAPIADFFANPTFNAPRLSPDARFLAVRVGGEGARDLLAVVDLVSNSVKVVASLNEADVGRFEWVNNKRLVFTSADQLLAPGQLPLGPGLFAVDRDGANVRKLIETGKPKNGGVLSREHQFMGYAGMQDSDAVFVYQPRYKSRFEITHVNLLQVDTVSGKATVVQRPADSRSWLLDARGEARLTTTLSNNIESQWYLDPATKQWRTLASYDTFAGGAGAFKPLGFGPDGAMYVVANGKSDKATLHSFDFKTGKPDPTPLVALEEFDFSGELLFTDTKLIGIRYLSDAYATVWLDEGMKKTQQQVDALMPNTINLISVARRAEMPWVLVDSYSDRQPHTYALFNTATAKLNPVGATQAQIKPAEMASQEMVRVKARDGLSIPAWLTIPQGAERKNLPMVVLIHGGPYVHGTSWGWSADAQFLASRGYAVLEPDFRGTKGYGMRYFRAGWKQWGLGMQNDVADATRWAIAQGIADPKRVCIAGASYGGYATLMGLVNDPDLYKCGINWVGVTDIGLMHTGDSSADNDFTDVYKTYGMPLLLGDPVTDAVRYKATSPLQQAARITQPLLMAYGGRDVRVPVYHGRKLYDAVKATNPAVEMVVYDDEAHGWRLLKNRVDFWGRVEKFLDQNIGKK